MRQRLTVYLLTDVATADDAIDPASTSPSIPLATPLTGALYYRSRPPKQPAWVAFVSPLVTLPPAGLQSSSASGMMVVKAGGDWFALTFGYGRSMLNQEKIVSRFGLKVVLNRVDPAQLRSMDSKKFEDIAVTKTSHASRSAALPVFGVDIASDIVRAVTGEARDDRLGYRISGSDAIVLTLDTSRHSLSELLVELGRAYRETSYRNQFDWVDNLQITTDPGLVEKLDDLLVDCLRAGDTSQTYMAMPDALDWGEIDAFRIAPTRTQIYDDLDIDLYLGRIGSSGRSALTIGHLKERAVKVSFNRSSDDWSKLWNVYKCLISEQQFSGRHFVLLEGSWFEVATSLLDRVNQFVDSISTSSLALTESQPGFTENDYNSSLAASSPEMLLLDAKIPRPGGSPSGVEFCDVLSSSGHLIHVKRKARSSTLSHLFAQGSVAGRTFLEDGEYRERVRKIIRKLKLPDEARWLEIVPDAATAPLTEKYTVLYVVIVNGTGGAAQWLPFFSKLNLMQHGRQVRNLGFKLEIARVEQR